MRPLAAAFGVLLALGSGAALADFPNDPPNDPDYDRAEEGGPETCAQRSVNDEQRYLYSFMPRCAPSASDPEEASGMSVDRAWRRFTAGDPRTVIAYVEGGVNWHDDPEELANRTFLNRGELPKPTTPKPDGQFSARDFADTKDANGNDVVDPEDIISRFSDGRDDDRNGYVDDISGWDFYNDQNDPATVDSEYGHANGQMEQAAAETDNGEGSAGICPRCMVLPIKAGAEALDRTDDLAQAWLYAADIGAAVVVSTTADLGYSTFMREAVERAWEKGVVMVESSNDFNSTDHQGGMFHPHVLPGNGLVSNTQGLDAAPGSDATVNAQTSTYRARSAFTSWGTHNVFSAATGGGTTSESTPTVGGVMALVLAYGKEAARKGQIGRPLSNAEAIQVVRKTASDVVGNPNPPNGWEGGPGWDLQYGYGRPNVFEAMKAISKGRIPPVGWIDSPRWYALYDPTRRDSVPVRGHVEARRASGYRWKLEFAPGAEPSESEFMTAGRGRARKPFDGRLGTIELSRIPESFWSAAFELSSTKELETNEQYTVTIRLRVTDSSGRIGEERRSIAVHHDPAWPKGFPKRIGPGGEAQPALADLRGGPALEIVLGDTDGRVHAISSADGRELGGFPVRTRPTEVERGHRGVSPGHEPVIINPAVGDLDGDGKLSIVAATTTGRVYVWDSNGKLEPGWPKTMDRGVRMPSVPRRERPFTRDPVRGATAAPILYDIGADRGLEIVQAAWDGHLYVWRPDGAPLRGWPVKVKLPRDHQPPSHATTLVRDHKLDAPPAIGDIDGDSEPELVLRSQYSDVAGGGLQPGLVSHLHAYEADGEPVPGFPVEAQAIIGYYGSAQEFITEGVSPPTLADVDGDGDDEIAFAPGIFSPTQLFDGDGSLIATYGPVPGATAALLRGEVTLEGLLDVLAGNLPEDAPVNFTTAGAFGRFAPAGRLAYAEPGSGSASTAGSLLLAGSGISLNNYMRAFDAQTADSLPGFPAKLQGLDFLGVPAIADVTGDGSAEIINAGDTSVMHAYGRAGEQVAGFPKFHTGWIVFGPSVGDLDGDGKVEVVAATREGYLFAWKTEGTPEGNQEWWAYRHDEWNTGRYGVDTRPPGKLRDVRLSGGGKALRFRAPGDDWYAGKVARYELIYAERGSRRKRNQPVKGKTDTKRLEPAGRAGSTEEVKIPPGYGVEIWAVDEAGNRSRRYAYRAR